VLPIRIYLEMSGSYKFIEHTADIAAEIEGRSLEELFSAGADAWMNSVTDLNEFEADDSIEIELYEKSIDELLITFLNELNYLLITSKWLYLNVQSIKIFNDEDGCELSAELMGIKLRNEIEIKHEIKSVTYHKVEIINKNDVYSTLVVFDI